MAQAHTGDKPFACTVCDAKFSTTGARYKHTCHHSKPILKPLVCAVCNAAFSKGVNLNQHMRGHSEEEFSEAGILDIYKRLHAGENKIVCFVCDVSFSNAEDLKMHKRMCFYS